MTTTLTDFFEGLFLSDIHGNEVEVNIDLECYDGPNGTQIVDSINIEFITVGDMGDKLFDEIVHVIWLSSDTCYDYSHVRNGDICIQ